MRQTIGTGNSPGEKIVKEITRATRKQYSSEEKIRIVLDGLRGEDSIAEVCRREGISQGVYYKWSKDFMEAGKKRVNAGPKLHRTPERKCTIWLDLAGVKLRQLVGFRFVHGPARRSAPTKQRSCAGLWSNRGAVFSLQALRDCRLCLRR